MKPIREQVYHQVSSKMYHQIYECFHFKVRLRVRLETCPRRRPLVVNQVVSQVEEKLQ